MKLLSIILFFLLDVIPSGEAFFRQCQPRDSILVADQVEYGFEIKDPGEGAVIEPGDLSAVFNDTLTLVRDWRIDTVLVRKKIASVRGTLVLAPFEEGHYTLPPVPVRVSCGGEADTLVFGPVEMDVRTIQVDTSTFQIKDIKGQISYPLTFAEVVPYLGGVIVLGALVALLCLVVIPRLRRKRTGEAVQNDPAHIVALRELDKYRGDKFWAPEKQKIFYSGITDALKNYIDGRFGVDAPEMTTAELFDALKNNGELTPEMFSELKELFENADFVKFAKAVLPDETNAKALPLAVRFVTTTYQSEIQEGGEQ